MKKVEDFEKRLRKLEMQLFEGYESLFKRRTGIFNSPAGSDLEWIENPVREMYKISQELFDMMEEMGWKRVKEQEQPKKQN